MFTFTHPFSALMCGWVGGRAFWVGRGGRRDQRCASRARAGWPGEAGPGGAAGPAAREPRQSKERRSYG